MEIYKYAAPMALLALGNQSCHLQKSFHPVAFFDFSVGEAGFAFVAQAGFGQVEIIVQVLQFLAPRGSIAFAFHDFDFAPGKTFF